MVQERGLEKQGQAGKTAQQKKVPAAKSICQSSSGPGTHTESMSSDLHIGILECSYTHK